MPKARLPLVPMPPTFTTSGRSIQASVAPESGIATPAESRASSSMIPRAPRAVEEDDGGGVVRVGGLKDDIARQVGDGRRQRFRPVVPPDVPPLEGLHQVIVQERLIEAVLGPAAIWAGAPDLVVDGILAVARRLAWSDEQFVSGPPAGGIAGIHAELPRARAR